MKKTIEYWKVFEKTGSVEDYLSYCRNRNDDVQNKIERNFTLELQAGGGFEAGDFSERNYTANGTSG